MSEKCKWLHNKVRNLPKICYPFNPDELPLNGIYFFYEEGEYWGHRGRKCRIVRIGTHKGNNFQKRISEHYLIDKSRMNFSRNNPKPSDRSIFRKNLGRVLLSRKNDSYLCIWEIDFTKRENRENNKHLRDISIEKDVERQITNIMQESFSFRFLIIEDEIKRIGKKGLESRLIGTVNSCSICNNSNEWLGRDSPKNKIRESGLWQVQHLSSESFTHIDKLDIDDAIRNTQNWYESQQLP